MEKSLKIAAAKDLLSTNEAKRIISEHKGFEFAKLGKKNGLDSIKSSLYAKEYDMACISLSSVDFVLPDGIVLAGVSKRYNPELKFIGSNSALAGKTLRDIKKGSKILAPNGIIKDQLLELLPEVNCKASHDSFEDMAKRLKSNDIDGFITYQYLLDETGFDSSSYYIWEFSPYEIVGTPAAGAVTYICRMDDIIVRKFIKNLHKAETSRSTNIERKVMKAFAKDKIAAFCFQDERNNYQIHASRTSEGNHRCFFTQSTTAGLAEKTIEILKDEANVSSI